MKTQAEDFGRERSSKKEKKYGSYHILTDELRLFDKECFFRFIRMTPNRLEHFTSNKMQLKLILFLFLAGRNFSGNKL